MSDIAQLRNDFDNWCKSTEFTRNTTRPADAGDQMALRDAHDLIERFDDALRDVQAQFDQQQARIEKSADMFREQHQRAEQAIDARDAAPWDELLAGGRFEAWLSDFSAALSGGAHE